MPSSVVANFHYNKDRRILRVVYVSGDVYDYKSVPEKVYVAMTKAFSKGAYLNTYVKPNYDFEKVE